MRKRIMAVMVLGLILSSSLAYASLDFTSTVANNAMLVLFLFTVAGTVAAGVAKYLWDKRGKELEDLEKKATEKEDEAYRTEMRLKEQEIGQLKIRLDRLEIEQNVCSRNLPINYVTKQEFDKFVLQHREEFGSLMNKMEGMIKEFRNEIKTDMQGQIDRIVDVIGRLIKEKE